MPIIRGLLSLAWPKALIASMSGPGQIGFPIQPAIQGRTEDIYRVSSALAGDIDFGAAYGLLALAAAVSAGLAVLFCRRCIRAGRRPPFKVAVLAAWAGTAATWLSGSGAQLFGFGYSFPEEYGGGFLLLVAMLLSVISATVMVTVARDWYRDKFRRYRGSHHEAKRERRLVWQRYRWFHLAGSSLLIAGSIAALLAGFSNRSPVPHDFIAPNFGYISPASSPGRSISLRPVAPPAPRGLLSPEATADLFYFGPVLVLGAIWLGKTLADWNGRREKLKEWEGSYRLYG